MQKGTTTVALALQRHNKWMPKAYKRSAERVSTMTDMDDLQGFVPLTIQDQRKYFDSQQGMVGLLEQGRIKHTGILHLLSIFKQQLRHLKDGGGQREPPIAPDLALKVLNYQNQQSAKYTTGTTAERNILESLPQGTQDGYLSIRPPSTSFFGSFWSHILRML